MSRTPRATTESASSVRRPDATANLLKGTKTKHDVSLLVDLPLPAVTRLISGIIFLLVFLSTSLQLVVGIPEESVTLRDSKFLNFLVYQFALDHETNVPTWYQTGALLACAMILVLIGISSWQHDQRRLAPYWIGIGCVFSILSLDEMASIHERTVEPLRGLFGIDQGPLYFAWIIPASVATFSLLVCLFPFLRKLPMSTRNRFLLSGVLYVFGAIGLETVGGAYLSANEGDMSIQWMLMTTTEECLEMVAVALFLVSLLSYMSDHGHHVKVTRA